jgi:antitoxin ParD1/3/4
VIREGIRLLEDRERRRDLLEAEIEKGLDDIRNGRTIPAEEVFAELRARYEAIAKKAVA